MRERSNPEHHCGHDKKRGAFARSSWLSRLLPLLVGVGAFAAGILLDVALGIENRPVLYSDVFTGAVAALPALFVARFYNRLRSSDAERMRVAADVNHHVRNALTTRAVFGACKARPGVDSNNAGCSESHRLDIA
jgi:hypothetical protein